MFESCFAEQRLRQLTCVPAPVKPDADGKNENRLHSTTRAGVSARTSPYLYFII